MPILRLSGILLILLQILLLVTALTCQSVHFCIKYFANVLASALLTTWCVFFPPLLHAHDCREGWVSFF